MAPCQAMTDLTLVLEPAYGSDGLLIVLIVGAQVIMADAGIGRRVDLVDDLS